MTTPIVVPQDRPMAPVEHDDFADIGRITDWRSLGFVSIGDGRKRMIGGAS